MTRPELSKLLLILFKQNMTELSLNPWPVSSVQLSPVSSPQSGSITDWFIHTGRAGSHQPGLTAPPVQAGSLHTYSFLANYLEHGDKNEIANNECNRISIPLMRSCVSCEGIHVTWRALDTWCSQASDATLQLTLYKLPSPHSIGLTCHTLYFYDCMGNSNIYDLPLSSVQSQSDTTLPARPVHCLTYNIFYKYIYNSFEWPSNYLN